jgi:hypothetical protein
VRREAGKQRRRQSESLKGIGNRKRNLRCLRALTGVARVADYLAARPEGGDQAVSAEAVGVGEAVSLLVKVRAGGEEAQQTRLLRQPMKERDEALLVVCPDAAHTDRGAVAQHHVRRAMRRASGDGSGCGGGCGCAQADGSVLGLVLLIIRSPGRWSIGGEPRGRSVLST